MHAVMRYTIKPDQLRTHLDLLGAVYADLATRQPEGIGWTTYQVTDTTTFIEFVEGPDLPHPLPHLKSFQDYRTDLDERCTDAREFLELRQIGTYQPVRRG